VLAILAINAMVFALWRFSASRPSLSAFLQTHFTISPRKLFREKRFYTIFTSAFSHADFFHFSFNMIAFYSFVPSILFALGDHSFMTFYLSSVVASGVAGQALQTIGPARLQTVVGLGASGAVLSLFMMLACVAPDAPMGIIFIPGISFSALSAVQFMLLFDTVGLLATMLGRATPFGHGTHLAGMLFGYWMFKYWYANDPVFRKRVDYMRRVTSSKPARPSRSSTDFD